MGKMLTIEYPSPREVQLHDLISEQFLQAKTVALHETKMAALRAKSRKEKEKRNDL